MTTTTISDAQKKNAAKALIALVPFRSDVDRWFHLIESRFHTAAWKNLLERDYLGLPERLAASGAELRALLNKFVDDPAINQSTLTEVIEYCVECEERQLSDSPQRTRFFLPTLDILEADLRSLSGSAETTIEPPDDPTSEGEWSAPLSMAEIARRITGNSHARSRDIDPIVKHWKVKPVSTKKVRVRLDTMMECDRAKIENPNFFQTTSATSR